MKQSEPELRLFTIEDWNGPITFSGRLLGYSSSEVDYHSHDGDTPQAGQRCSKCRWTEVSIYKTSPKSVEARYCVYTVGKSRLHGESDRSKVRWTESPYEVVEILNVRKSGSPSLPGPSARALAQAAEYDDGINDAYHNRVVA